MRTQGSRPRPRPRTQKKIRGQGQGKPFRGQTLSRPRTGMLEAKAKDQGHKRKCSPKKKGLHKNFSGDLQKKTFSKKFFKRFNKSKNRPIFEDLSPRGQGQGLQNVSSRTSSRPRTSSRTPSLVKSVFLVKKPSLKLLSIFLNVDKRISIFFRKSVNILTQKICMNPLSVAGGLKCHQ